MKKLVLALLAVPFALAAQPAEISTPNNRVSFSVEVQKEVPMDILQVRLFVQEEGKELKPLHKTIDEKINLALSKIKAQKAVTIQSNHRNTVVRYNEKGQKNGWVERADFVLESKDFYALSQLVDEVSDQLSIESIQALLSPEAKEKLEDEMMRALLAKFRHKAEFIQTGLQAKGYRLVQLNLPKLNAEPFEYDTMLAASPRMAKMEAAPEPVQLESGTTQIKVTANATIDLQ
ncbi:SIMPL domain-containing protein [Bisgaard Taxon 10/6]|uniref:SIMPL domain-containing protein n=1 Tax=Exercitatus varius TaxID=67857 RepID=UPI00294B1E88|nr:SIMPL domain-containing protein [Exercitatus varius]MDG2914912.1 SIMPL domain-containing protein [Exercitatus varius]MDG2952650.1 SIMPL domain-containing protein [Exercitatus varius]